MIILNISTKFEYYRSYPIFTDLGRIKIQMLIENNYIYDNPKHSLLSWWELKSYFNSLSIDQDNIPLIKHAFGSDGRYVSRSIPNCMDHNTHSGSRISKRYRATLFQGPVEDNGNNCTYKTK